MGFQHFLIRVPEKALSVVCLCNLGSIDAKDLAFRVGALFGAWEQGGGR